MLGIGMLKFAVMLAKLPGIFKAAFVAAAIPAALLAIASLIVAEAPVANPWFDAFAMTWVLIFLGAIVAGEPEPDVVRMVIDGKMKWIEFFYLWFFRTSHIIVQAGTAFFMHPKKWSEISGPSRQVRSTDTGD